MNRLFGSKSNVPKPTLNDALGNVSIELDLLF